MRSDHQSLRAHIAVDSTQSTASVSASAHDYKSILHTCNLRSCSSGDWKGAPKKKGLRPEGYRQMGQNTDWENFQGEKLCSVTWRQGGCFASAHTRHFAQFSLTTDVLTQGTSAFEMKKIVYFYLQKKQTRKQNNRQVASVWSSNSARFSSF